MANTVLNKAKCERLFGITRDFWESSLHCYKELHPYEYENNAHPYQEYLADMRTQYPFIKEQLNKLQESNILTKIEEAIEVIKPLAVKELMGEDI
tara:strand:- start:264 stop:548 length:285 start_codon:yes stop_codon:yes gene_type:complete